MSMISGTLEDASQTQMQGANGPWTKNILTIAGKHYQAHTKVYNQAAGWLGHRVQAEVDSKTKANGFTDWYVNAVFLPDGSPTPTIPMTAVSRPSGTLTEMGKNASICRQVAAKLLVEAGVAPGSEVFWLEIGPIARYFATGEHPKPVQSLTEPPEATPEEKPKPGYIEQETFIPANAKIDPYDETATDSDIPFMPTSMNNTI